MPLAPAPKFRFGSWVGGDRDGNPAVTPEVTVAAARLARSAVLRRYRDDVQSLGRDLSISGRLVGCTPELLDSIDRDRAELGMQAVPQWRDEPYRRKLGLIGERLRRTESAGAGALRLADAARWPTCDWSPTSLQAHGGARIASGGLLDLRRRVEAFGFSLAELEIRQHAERHTAAVAELLGAGRRAPATSGWPRPSACACSKSSSTSDAPFGMPAEALAPATREVLETFQAMATCSG